MSEDFEFVLTAGKASANKDAIKKNGVGKYFDHLMAENKENFIAKRNVFVRPMTGSKARQPFTKLDSNDLAYSKSTSKQHSTIRSLKDSKAHLAVFVSEFNELEELDESESDSRSQSKFLFKSTFRKSFQLGSTQTSKSKPKGSSPAKPKASGEDILEKLQALKSKITHNRDRVMQAKEHRPSAIDRRKSIENRMQAIRQSVDKIRSKILPRDEYGYMPSRTSKTSVLR